MVNFRNAFDLVDHQILLKKLKSFKCSDTCLTWFRPWLSPSGTAEGHFRFPSRKLLRIKVTPDLHLTYRRNGGNLGLILKIKNIACISILLTKHLKIFI